MSFYGGDVEIINLLIQYGADVTISDMFNVTPLHNVVRRNDIISAYLLFDAAVAMKSNSVEKMINFRNDEMHTPLDLVRTPEMTQVFLIAELEDLPHEGYEKEVI